MKISLNGIELNYVTAGQGEPIILLHGNSESHKIFKKLICLLSEKYTVYAIDSRGHGKSTKVRKLNYLDMAEDIVEFIKLLQLNKPILYGFSDGGILGLIISSRYPNLLSKLIISGANTNPHGIKRGYFALLLFIYKITKSTKFKMMVTQPDIKEEELKVIIIPTLVLAGSKDMILEEHTRFIAESIPNSTLSIQEGESHMSYVMNHKKLYNILASYLA